MSERVGWARRVLAVCTLALVASACTGDPETTPDGDDGGDGNGTISVPNPDTFVHVQNGEPASLDPARAEQGEKGEEIISNVYERLLEVGPGGPDLGPSLATEVPSEDNGLVSEDGLTYTFPIREGVTFHDGTDLSCADVEFSFDRLLTMNLPEGQAYLLGDTADSLRCVDDMTFEITLRQIDASFLNSVVISPALSIVSEDAVEANGGIVADEPNEFMDANAVGTGPYEMTEWTRGQFMTLTRFADYWGEPASLDVRIEVTEDESARLLQLQAGEADSIDMSPSNVSEVDGVEGIAIESGQLTLEPVHMAFNLNLEGVGLPSGDTIPPDFFYDVRVRQAFSYAFDYQTYQEQFLEGFGERYPAYVPIGVLGYDETAPIYEYDPAQAEALFRETGWWDEGFSLSILVQSGEPEFEGVALLMKDGLEQMNPNFRVGVVTKPEAAFDRDLGSVPVPFAMWVKNGDPFADPHPFMFTYQHPDGVWGEIHGYRNGYEDPDTIARLIDDGVRTTDVEEREAIYAELQRLLYEDPMWVYASQEGLAVPYRDWVQGFVVNPLWRGLQYKYFSK